MTLDSFEGGGLIFLGGWSEYKLKQVPTNFASPFDLKADDIPKRIEKDKQTKPSKSKKGKYERRRARGKLAARFSLEYYPPSRLPSLP